jgi:SET domain-containing protein
MDIIVKQSKIHGKGVFANKDFKKGDAVIKWKEPNLIDKQDIKKVLKKDKKYLSSFNGKKYIIQGIPERYVNHSCNANTKADRKKKSDVAIRKIKKGEEITANYLKENIPGLNLKCNCGSRNCKRILKND